MQVFLALGFVFVTGLFALPGQAGMLGGENPIEEDDKVYVEKAKQMITKDMLNNYKEEEGYKTSIVCTDMEFKKQVVNGLLYKAKWKTTYNYRSIKGNLEEKPSNTVNCEAKVWFKSGGGGQQYAPGGEPMCVDSNHQ